MNIHEYQAKALMRAAALPVQHGYFVTSSEEARRAYGQLESTTVVVKAQVHAGGRGQAGGVKKAETAAETADVAAAMLGSTLRTHQTGATGKVVHGLYVEAACEIAQEYYLSLLVDRSHEQVALLFSEEGGVNIEDVAAQRPEKLIHIGLNYYRGFRSYHGYELQEKAGLSDDLRLKFSDVIHKLWQLFLQHDCQLLEINPLCVLKNGDLCILDAKWDSDDNALFRQPDILALRDLKEEDPAEVEASQYGLSYVGLEGDIGCLVNGAGLAMATMDIIKLHGGEPLNFLDVGGGASAEQVEKAVQLILNAKGLKAIFINIFGGIMHCDVIAKGVVEAFAGVAELPVPVVVRLEGTRVQEGRDILAQAPWTVHSVATMEEGAQKVVALAGA